MKYKSSSHTGRFPLHISISRLDNGHIDTSFFNQIRLAYYNVIVARNTDKGSACKKLPFSGHTGTSCHISIVSFGLLRSFEADFSSKAYFYFIIWIKNLLE